MELTIFKVILLRGKAYSQINPLGLGACDLGEMRFFIFIFSHQTRFLIRHLDDQIVVPPQTIQNANKKTL